MEQVQYNNEVTTAMLTGSKKTSTEIKVTVHTPDSIPESVRRQKINKLYDILKPQASVK
jgi:hypothetical protein